MPNDNNRIGKQELLELLRTAELNISKFQPPSASPIVQNDPNTPPPPPNLERIQQEVAQKSAQEKTDALYDFLIKLITQTCKDELDRQNISAAISALRAEVSSIREILSRRNLT